MCFNYYCASRLRCIYYCTHFEMILSIEFVRLEIRGWPSVETRMPVLFTEHRILML